MGFLIDMIDVGYGDSFLLTLDDPQAGEVYVLIDGGIAAAGKKVVEYLSKYTNGHLSLVIATHLDDDHIGGLLDVVRSFSIGQFIINMPGTFADWLKLKAVYESYGAKAFSKRHLVESLETASSLAQVIEYKKVSTTTAFKDQVWQCGDVALKVLNPSPDQVNAAWAEAVLKESTTAIINESLYGRHESAVPLTTDSNNAGIVIELQYQNRPYALFAADVGAAILKTVTGGTIYNFLKVPHHGSKTGMDEVFVNQFREAIAFLPVGDNSYGHPATEVLDLLRSVNAKTYCTQRTKYCRKSCSYNGFGSLSLPINRALRTGWSTTDSKKCINNQLA